MHVTLRPSVTQHLSAVKHHVPPVFPMLTRCRFIIIIITRSPQLTCIILTLMVAELVKFQPWHTIIQL